MSQHSTGTVASRETGQNTTVGVLAHIVALFTGILGAAVVYLIASDEFGKRNAANALNWQLFLLVAVVGIVFLAGVGMLITDLALILVLAILPLSLADTIFCIIAAVKASNGEAWSYPIAPNLL